MVDEEYWLGIGWDRGEEAAKTAGGDDHLNGSSVAHAKPSTRERVPRRFHLSEKNLERHLPVAGKVLHDTERQGLVLRASQFEERSWYVVKFFKSAKAIAAEKKGETVYYRLGRYPDLGLKAAREEARGVLELFAKGIDPRERGRDSDRMFELVAAKFLSSAKRTRSYEETERIIENELKKVWKGRDVRTIERRHVTMLLEPIAARAPVMANRVAGVISRFFNFAIDKGLIGAHPAARLKPPGGRESSRERVYSDDELRKLWRAFEHMGHPFGRLFQFLLITPQRRGEAANAVWKDVDQKDGLWNLPRTKAGVSQVVPLTPMAVEFLASLPRLGRRIFSVDGKKRLGGWSKAARRVRTLSGVEDFRIHDFRRVVRTNLSKLGVDADTAERVLGHVIRGVRGVYDRYEYLAEKRGALEKWTTHLVALLAKNDNEQESSPQQQGRPSKTPHIARKGSRSPRVMRLRSE